MDLSESMFLILCHSMDCSLLGSSVYGILQARILEWVAISSSMGSSQPRDRTQGSCIAGIFFAIWATLWVHLVWDCFFWAWRSVSFYRLGKFSAVISSNMFSAPFPFFLPLGRLNVNVSILDVVSEALKPSLFVNFFFFFFCCSDWVILLFCLSDVYLFFCTMKSTVDSLLCIFHYSYCIIHLWFFFLIVSDSLLRFSLCSSTLHPSLGIIFMIISLNCVSDNLLICLLWGLLMRGCLLSFGKYFSVSSFCLALCFYAVGRKATCLSLEEVVLCGWLAYSMSPVLVSVISWPFIAVYAAWFILHMLLFLRICQDLPVF